MTLIAISAFALSLILTYLIIFISKRKGVLRNPTEERWHKKPTPSLGGIAVFLTFISITLIFSKSIREMLPIILGGAAIFALGLLDDIFDIKPYTKLLLEIGVACIMIMCGVHLIFSPNPIIFIPLTILWIVGVTNAFNLFDNMDGLSPGIGAIASLILLMLSIKLDKPELLIPSLVLASTLIAFLIFNFNPAKIFLGDCGALFIGFILATLSIKGTWQQASNLFLVLLAPLLILGIPIFDTFFVSLQRKLHGLPIMQGGKDHSSHRLVILGWSEKKTAIFFYTTSIILGLSAIVGLDYNIFVQSVIFAVILLGVVMFGIFLAQTRVYGKKEESIQSENRGIKIAAVLYKRRILDILIDSTTIIIAYFTAYLIKYDGVIDLYSWELISQSLPIILFVKLASLYLTGLYEGVWKYIDFDDSLKILKGTLFGSMASIIILVGFTRFEGYSRSLFLLDFIIYACLISGTRIILRTLRESFYSYSITGKKVLLVGAGEAGKMVLTELRKNREIDFYPIGILDDDVSKHGKKLMGVTVLGSSGRIAEIVAERDVSKVIITIPSASEEEKSKIIEMCKEAKVEYKFMKGFEELF